jgi:hypothetical protein
MTLDLYFGNILSLLISLLLIECIVSIFTNIRNKNNPYNISILTASGVVVCYYLSQIKNFTLPEFIPDSSFVVFGIGLYLAYKFYKIMSPTQ